jgi:hypothetical protein
MLCLDLHDVCTVGSMRTITLPLPVLGFIVSTRAALAAGLALLFGDRLPAQRRRAVGLALVGVGAATTIPAAWSVSRSLRRRRTSAVTDSDARLIGVTRYPRKGDDIA